MVTCSGRLGKFETKTLTVRWGGNGPMDVCSTARPAYGDKVLDWSKCDFEINLADLR